MPNFGSARIAGKSFPALTAAWLAVLLTVLAWAAPAGASSLPVDVDGVEPEVAENIRYHLQAAWVLGPRLVSERQRTRFLERARTQAALAMRPWGFYRPDIDARLRPGTDGAPWVLELRIKPGPVVRVRHVDIVLVGPGAGETTVTDWRARWPLTEGTVLRQDQWERAKEDVLELLQERGYFLAEFTHHRIALDLERHSADLELTLATGQRAVMGEVDYQQSVVQPYVLRPIARFDPGDPYLASWVELLRLDLWKTGYFSDIEVREDRQLSLDPPLVNFQVLAQPRNRTTHQGALGYGTDTQLRAQYHWTRPVLSDRGDSLVVGLGWRQRDSEFRVSADYRLPRDRRSQQYWISDTLLRRESEAIAIQDANGEERGRLVSGRITDLQFKLGRLKLRDQPWGTRRIAETLFVDVLLESSNLGDRLLDRESPGGPPGDTAGLESSLRTVAVGMSWDWPVIRGSGFDTHGHHEEAWWFDSRKAWGSDRDFRQMYLASRWSIPLGEDWKLLLRGELGYTDAKVVDVEVTVDGQPFPLSVTELPARYRFETGGSQSVRGYDFDRLSTNGIGSNHLLTASAELERRFAPDWSAAVFIDAGNAFNDWSDAKLKRGWGGGVRWYSQIGVLRLDLARAEDLAGQPWQFYISIGTPLL